MGCETSKVEFWRSSWTAFPSEEDPIFYMETNKKTKIGLSKNGATELKARIEVYLAHFENKEGD
jgi:hypothetical protein